MRFALAVVALATLTACTTTPTPTPPAPSSSQGPCELGQVELGGSASSAEQVFTAVRRINENGNTVLIDQTVVPAIAWAKPGVDTNAALETLATEHNDKIAAAPHAGMSKLDAFLEGLKSRPGTHVGYAAVTRQSYDVTAKCADGRAFSGTVTSWTKSDIGATTCGFNMGADAPAAAVRAQKEFC